MKRLALVVLLFSTAAAALPGETWLVVIGNNEGARDEQGLLYAERDAREIADVFRRLGPISSDRIAVLLDEPAETVRRTLQSLNAAIRVRTQEGAATALLVFYSGHADAVSLHLRGTELAFDELKELVAGSPAAVRLLVVDACRSGTVTRVKGVTEAPSFELRLKDDTDTSGMAILTSSAAGESSQESDRLRGSFFTHHLVNALRGAADQNSDGRVTLSEAYSYTYAETLTSSGQTLLLQHPTYSWDLKGRGVLVLSEPGRLRGQVGRLRLPEPATYLVLEGGAAGAVTAEVTAPDGGRQLALPAGAYFVQERMASEFREYQVSLGSGQEIDLASVPYRQVRYDLLVRQRGGTSRFAQSLTVIGAARGGINGSNGVYPQVSAAYGLDFPWVSASLRLRATRSTGNGGPSGPGGLQSGTHDEIGAGVLAQRYLDFSQGSLSAGLWLEMAWHRLTYQTAPDRTQWSPAAGVLLAGERQIWRGLSLRLEAGPAAYLLKRTTQATVTNPHPGFQTAVTWWVGGGMAWRL